MRDALPSSRPTGVASVSLGASQRPRLPVSTRERPASIDVAKLRQLKAKGTGPSEIAKAVKIGRASDYRALGSADRVLVWHDPDHRV
jgi:hypothetical protein